MLTRIDHVGIAVHDLDAAIDFYERTFGAEGRAPGDERGAGRPRGDARRRRPGACVQLLAPLTPDSPVGKFLERGGEGVHQVAYGVDDVAAVSDTLRGRGLRLLEPRAKRGTAGSLVNFVHPKDAGGVLVELVEGPHRRTRVIARPRPRRSLPT